MEAMLRVKNNHDPGYSLATGKRKRKKHIFVAIVLSLMLFTIGRYGFNRISHHSAVFGKGEIRYSNSQSYVYVEAEESYDLGYLTGREMAAEILSLKLILQSYMPLLSMDYQEALTMATEFLPFIPNMMIEEMNGMAEGVNAKMGSNLAFLDILLQNTWVDLIYGNILSIPEDVLGCTVLSSRNSNGTAVYGQNFDFTKIFRHTFKYVHHKLGSNPAIFGLRIGGGLNLPTGKSEKGFGLLTTVVNTNVKANFSIPIMCRTRLAFHNANSAQEAIEMLFDSSLPLTTSGSITAIDDISQIGVEFTPTNMTYNNSLNLIKTNTFSEESWQQFLSDPEYSKNRQEVAEILLNDVTFDRDCSEPDLISILQTTPGIYRTASSYKETGTLAFFSKSYFALGDYTDSILGEIPF